MRVLVESVGVPLAALHAAHGRARRPDAPRILISPASSSFYLRRLGGRREVDTRLTGEFTHGEGGVQLNWPRTRWEEEGARGASDDSAGESEPTRPLLSLGSREGYRCILAMTRY